MYLYLLHLGKKQKDNWNAPKKNNCNILSMLYLNLYFWNLAFLKQLDMNSTHDLCPLSSPFAGGPLSFWSVSVFV